MSTVLFGVTIPAFEIVAGPLNLNPESVYIAVTIEVARSEADTPSKSVKSTASKPNVNAAISVAIEGASI